MLIQLEASPSIPARSLDLQGVEEKLRWQAWARAADLFFPGLNVRELSPSPSEGHMRGQRFGPGELWTIHSPPLHVEYTAGRGDTAGHCGLPLINSFSIMLQIGGSTSSCQNGRTCCLEPGDICLIDGAVPFDLEVIDSFSQLMFVRMPRALLLARHPYLERQTAINFAPQEAGATLLRSVLLEVLKMTGLLEEQQCTAVLTALAQMLGVLKPPFTEMSWRAQAALSYIDAHLSEASLTAERIAEAQHMSRRRLDDVLLKSVGTSLTGQIWLRRVLQAREDLLNPRHAGRSVGDIGFDCGFTDTAHFTRVFKRHFGCPPREWRNRNFRKRSGKVS